MAYANMKKRIHKADHQGLMSQVLMASTQATQVEPFMGVCGRWGMLLAIMSVADEHRLEGTDENNWKDAAKDEGGCGGGRCQSGQREGRLGGQVTEKYFQKIDGSCGIILKECEFCPIYYGAGPSDRLWPLKQSKGCCAGWSLSGAEAQSWSAQPIDKESRL